MKFLLDHAFLAYRVSQFPIITNVHKTLIQSRIASYIYLKYLSSSSDLIPKYKSSDDVDVTITSGNVSASDTEVTYLIINEELLQMVVFVNYAGGVIALVKSHMPLFVILMLESLDLDTPLVLQSIPISTEIIHKVVDGMDQIVQEDPNCFGNVDLLFLPKEKLFGDSLREISLYIPSRDTKRIIKSTQLPPLKALLSWLTDQTSLKFSNLTLRKFDSQLLSIHASGRLSLIEDRLLLETTIARVLGILCESFNVK